MRIMRRKGVFQRGSQTGREPKAIHRRRLAVEFLSGPCGFGPVSSQLVFVGAEAALSSEEGTIPSLAAVTSSRGVLQQPWSQAGPDAR